MFTDTRTNPKYPGIIYRKRGNLHATLSAAGSVLMIGSLYQIDGGLFDVTALQKLDFLQDSLHSSQWKIFKYLSILDMGLKLTPQSSRLLFPSRKMWLEIQVIPKLSTFQYIVNKNKENSGFGFSFELKAIYIRYSKAQEINKTMAR